MAVLNGAESRLDSLKRLKSASLQQKLNAHQKMQIAVNSALLSDSVNKLRQMYPNSEIPHLLTAAKKKSEKQIIEHLKVSNL